MHIPWDKVDDYAALAAHAKNRGGDRDGQLEPVPGRRLQARHRLTHPDPKVRAKAIAHQLSAWTSWTPPGRGTSRSGSPTARTTRARTTPRPAGPARRIAGRDLRGAGRGSATAAGVQDLRAVLLHDGRAGLGHLVLHCLALGERAKVILDTGHHAPATNIEFIVMQLLRPGRLGGVRLQLPVQRRRRPDGRGRRTRSSCSGSCVRSSRRGRWTRRPGWRSCSTSATTSSRRSRAQIRSVMNVQEATAKALLVDRDALAAAQQAGTCSARTGC